MQPGKVGDSIAAASMSTMNSVAFQRTARDRLRKPLRYMREGTMKEMQQIIRDDGGQVIPSFVNILSAAASRVKNPVTNPVSALEWIAESCWLEA